MKENLKENNDKSVNSAGERSIAVGGSVSNSTIHTGDVVYIYGQDNQSSSVVLNILSTKIENLSTDLSKEIAANLEELREKFRAGLFDEGFEGVQLLRNSSNWDSFEPELRSSILRALASMTLALRGNDGLSEARKLADEARQTTKSENDDVLRARIKIFEEGFEAAINDFAGIKNIESYNLWLNCLLNTGKFSEVLDSRKSPPKEVQLNAESHRFFALALLATKNIAEAEVEIKKAQVEKPNWQYVRFTAAIIDYYSALSPTVLPSQLVAYPRPFYFEWAKIDDESQRKLSASAVEFEELAKQFKTGNSGKRECETWHFACVANLLGRQQEAIEIGKKLLEKDPTNLQILSWFLFRSYEFDYENSLHLLEQREINGNISIEDLLGLIGIYLRMADLKKALEILDRRKEVFASEKEINLWRYWRGTTLLQSERVDDALAEEAEITDEDLSKLLKLNIFNYQGQILNNWKPLTEFLRERYKKDNDLDAFLSLYEIKALKVKNEKFIADNAELYCETMQTASAVNFTVNALWNLGRSQKCVELLEKYESFFPNSKLPSHLRRLKIHCLIKSNVRKALQEADELVKEDDSVENTMLLMDVHLVRGDLTGLQVASKKLLKRTDVNARDLLRAAHLVQVKDENLASKFWMRAIEVGVDDPQLVAFAQGLASKLGLESESSELMQRMMQHAHEGRGPMKLVSIRQLLKSGEKWSKAQQEIDKKYGTGEIPLQLLSNKKNMPLAKIFIWLADKNKESRKLHQTPRLLTRHGARILYPLRDFANSKNWNLHLDITSLLLAHKLNILEKLEKLLKPLKISRHTVTALIEQRDSLRPHQKSQLENSQTIADLFDKNKMKLSNQNLPTEVFEEIYRLVGEFQKNVKSNNKGKKHRRIKKKRIVFADSSNLERHLGDRLTEIAHAINENGFAVSFLPLNCYGTKGSSNLKLPENLENIIVNARVIVDSLKAHSRISEEKYNQVVRSLGVEGDVRSQVSPLLQSKLFLMSGIADLLAGANILQNICENFEVVISESSLAEARGKIQYYKEMDELGESLDELIVHINDGLDEGVYEFIHIPDQKVKKERISEGEFGQDIKSTLDLLLFEPQEWDVVCIDDRALTKHAFRQENQKVIPIISINELLSALLQNGEIDEQTYYDKLLELRRCNFRYIPISDNEIVYYLGLASITNGRVIETEALSVLRQYHSSCLLDKEILQISGNQFSELPFIVHGIESVASAIGKVWKDKKSSDEIATARADWIFENLYTGNLGCSHLQNKTDITDERANELNFLALDVCSLLLRGLFLDGSNILPNELTKSSRFFEWLTERVMTTRCVSSPEIYKAIAEQIAEKIKFTQLQNYKNPIEKTYAGIFMGRFFLNLPEVIAKEINLDQETSNWLRIRVGNTIKVGDENFDAVEYWRAIEKGLAEEKVSIKATNSENEYFFLPEQSDEKDETDRLFPTFKVTDADGNQIDLIQDPSFGIFAANIETRLNVIHKLRTWFDSSQEEFEEKAKEIAQIEDSIDRITQFYQAREISMVFYYRNLEERFRNREIITWQELMPPSADSLAGYFRLPLSEDNKDFSEIWSKAADLLINEEELPFAISRVSSLPMKMPQAVIERFLQLRSDEKADLLRRLSPAWASPIQLLHLINLAARSLPSENENISEIAKELLSRLYQQKEDEDIFAAFHATLSFVKDEFYYWQEGAKLSPTISLAVIWGHATRLYNIQRALGIKPKNIISGLSNRRESYFFESLARKPEFWNDCVYPRRISRIVFLTQLIAKLFAGADITVLDSLGIPELIRKEVFRQNDGDGAPVPATELLCDPMLYEDKLKSLFGGDRFKALSPIIGIENIEVLKSENLKQSVKIFLERMIDDSKDAKNWVLVYAVINDLPIYEELQELCVNALKTLSQNFQLANEIENKDFVLFAAASQVVNFGDENLRNDFIQNVLERFKMLESDDNYEETLKTRATLVDAALALSYVKGDSLKSNEEFVAVIEKMDNEWRDFTDKFGYIFANIFWNLPLSGSRSWHCLNLKLRAIESNEN
jgi:hypothetical protein